MLKFIKQAFIVVLSFNGSLARVAKVSNQTKCIPSNKKQCLARPTLVDLISNELHYYLFIISLNRRNGSCNAFDDLSSRICFLNKTEHINLNIFISLQE